MSIGFGIIGSGMMGSTYAEAMRTQAPAADLDTWETVMELPPWDWAVEPKAPRRIAMTARQVEQFATVLESGGSPDISGRDGRAAIEMVEAAIRSARSGEAQPIPLVER